uniref:Uncharacterized protein n=1 Tax=Arundo donax TaxID=35708 RepID=A0A0A8Z4X5_ARUDO
MKLEYLSSSFPIIKLANPTNISHNAANTATPLLLVCSLWFYD